ncbi:hypothetical protein L914_11108, partial [Phytophthora nicotianae]
TDYQGFEFKPFDNNSLQSRPFWDDSRHRSCSRLHAGFVYLVI